MTRPTLALALPVKNEEKALQGCIDSVAGVDDPGLDCFKVVMHNGDAREEYLNALVFRNRGDIVYVGDVHERAMRDYGRSPLRAKTLENVRIGYELRPNGARNMAIIRNVLMTRPGAVDDLWWQRIAAREYWAHRDGPSTVYWYGRYVETYRREGRNIPTDLADAYFTLACACLTMGEHELAKSRALAALGINADFRAAAGLLADISALEGNEQNRLGWTQMFSRAGDRGNGLHREGARMRPSRKGEVTTP
ncbi:MAG: hypothetical protein ABSC19_04995 [Syntrophorhabdales bacterium]|jgi:hypothetical protein